MEAAAGDCLLPGRAAGFQEVEGAHHIGVHEITRAGDRAVHVGLGRQMHDVGDVVPLHDFEHGGLVAQIHLLEAVLWVTLRSREVLEAAGIGQAVEIDELGNLRPVDDMVNEVRADKARPARD